MKVYIKKSNILNGIQKATNLTSSKTGTSYLKAIWLKTDENNLKVMSTDSKLEFIGIYPANIEKTGLVGVLGKHFFELIKRLPEDDISLVVEKESLILSQGKRKYKLSTYDSSWFQEFSIPPEEMVTWSGILLKAIINKIYFTIGDEEDENLNNLKICPSKEGSFFEACGLNNHQFAMIKFQDQEICSLLGKDGILIPKSYLPEIRKWLEDEDIYIGLQNNRLFLLNKNKTELLSVPLSVTPFPNYYTFLSKFGNPKNSIMKIKKKEFIEALQRLIIFNTETQRCCYFAFKNNELTIYSHGYDIGEAIEKIDIEFKGDLKKIVFPTKDIIEILNHFDCKYIYVEFTDEEGPVKFFTEEEIDKNYFVITTPVEISEEIYYTEEEME